MPYCSRYLVLSYGWFSFDFNESSSSPAGFLVIVVQWIVVIVERAFFAAYFAVIGAGIWRELDPARAAALGRPCWRRRYC